MAIMCDCGCLVCDVEPKDEGSGEFNRRTGVEVPRYQMFLYETKEFSVRRSLVQNFGPGLYLTGLCLLVCSRVLGNN
jgi:hypothetical protein